eukprot:3519971-Rhodomonas_salina.2
MAESGVCEGAGARVGDGGAGELRRACQVRAGQVRAGQIKRLRGSGAQGLRGSGAQGLRGSGAQG